MSYLLAQIFICLLIAGLIGALIGWWLRGGCRNKLRNMDNDWTARYDADKAVWQGKIDAAESHIKQGIHNNNDEWDVRFRDAESNWEGKVQTLVGNYDSELSKLNLEKQGLENALLTAQAEVKDARLELSTVNDSWTEKVKNIELDWEGKVQGVKSNYATSSDDSSVELEELKAKLTSTEMKLIDSENAWNLKLKDTESSWENKLQGVMGDYNLKREDNDQEVTAVKDELVATRTKVQELQQKLVDSEHEWNLKLKDSESSWEGKMQGIISDYDSKISKADRVQQTLKADLNMAQSEANEAKTELMHADQELFSTIGNLDECYDVEEIEGIGPGYGKRFKSMGVHTTCDFVERFLHDQDAAKKAASETKIDLSAIQAWASMADLIKLPGVDGQYAEIMQVVGVSSRDELSKLNAKTLHSTMVEYNANHAIVPDVPSLDLILRWMESPDSSKIVAALGSAHVMEDMNECYDIEEVEGIGPTYGKKLRSMGINTTCDLARSCLRDNRATKKISNKMQVNFDALRAWASMSDLMRLPGVGGQFAEIMQTVGISSRKELTGTNVKSLQSKMVAFNTKKPIVPEVPSVDMLIAWVAAAKNQKH